MILVFGIFDSILQSEGVSEHIENLKVFELRLLF